MKTTTPTAIKFAAGRTYRTRSACDHKCIFGFEIVRRSAASVWIREEGGAEVKRRKITVYRGVETFAPFGSYSMSPIISADRPSTEAV